jgi:hypothetical protein
VRRTTNEFLEDGLQDSPAITEGVEVRDTVDTVCFERANFGNLETGLVDTDIDEGLDFETVTVDVHDRYVLGPESVVAVAKVGELAAVHHVGKGVEAPVANTTEASDVGGATTEGEAGAFGEVSAIDKGFDVSGDFRRVGGAISVEHDDDVTRSSLETVLEGVALASAGLVDDADIGAQRLSDLDGVIGGESIDDDDFVDVLLSQELKDVGQVLCLVQGGNDDRNLGWLYNAEVRASRDVRFGAGEVNDDVVTNTGFQLHEGGVISVEIRLLCAIRRGVHEILPSIQTTSVNPPRRVCKPPNIASGVTTSCDTAWVKR